MNKIDDKEIISLIKNCGYTATYVAKFKKVGVQRVINILFENNMLEYIPRLDEYNTNLVIDLYKKGINCKNIVKIISKPLYLITNTLRLNNISVEKKFHLNRNNKIDHNFFSNIDTEKKAYWLGFLMADGNLSPEYTTKYQIEISLQEQDGYILNDLKDSMNAIYNIKDKKIKYNNKIFKYKKFIFYSKDLWNDLNNKGCVPRKSTILKFPNEDIINNKYMHHFIRGYFDGNGSVYVLNPYKAYNVGGININGSKDFIEGLSYKIKQIFGYKLRVKKGHGNVYYINTASNPRCVELMKYLYKDATVFLLRKYNKFKIIEDLYNNSINKRRAKLKDLA